MSTPTEWGEKPAGWLAVWYLIASTTLDPYCAARVWAWFVQPEVNYALGYWAFFGLLALKGWFFQPKFSASSKPTTNQWIVGLVVAKATFFGACASVHYFAQT